MILLALPSVAKLLLISVRTGFVLLLGAGDAMISCICDSPKSVQSQGIEKQPTKKRKSRSEKHPAILSVGLVIILGEVNNGSGV